MRRAVLTVPVLLVSLATAISTATPAAAASPPPSKISAVGDSITRAFDVSGSYFLKDAPEESWSTGSDPKVGSEYLQLQALNPAIARENDAVTGAKMADLAGQMTTATTNSADYVTVLMGANDVCTKTVAAMTPTTTFQTQFEAAMAVAKSKNAHVFVSSIPRVNRLYELYSGSGSARFAWSVYGVCQDLLSSRATIKDRSDVAARVVADNQILESVCTSTTYSGICTWDGGKTYGIQFEKADVSTVDYFHPSIVGQAKLAAAAWSVSPYKP